jgi:UDP:flavonoid glycosyltransferase YjiC (YdhE family)
MKLCGEYMRSLIPSVFISESYTDHDGSSAGVPQVLLPPWADCYDFANRAELLGIGVWGNKLARPRWKREELASALVNVILGPDAEKTRTRAAELACRYPENTGRDKAAEEILKSL